MTTRGWVVILVLCVFFSGFVGYLIRGSGTGIQVAALSWGYEEEKQVWNRIRVDEYGYVMCHKE